MASYPLVPNIDQTTWEWQVSLVVYAIRECEGVKAYVLKDNQPVMPVFAPRGYIEFHNPDRIDGVIGKLRDGKPSVVVRRSGNRIIIDPMTTCSGEEEVFAGRLKEVLT